MKLIKIMDKFGAKDYIGHDKKNRIMYQCNSYQQEWITHYYKHCYYFPDEIKDRYNE